MTATLEQQTVTPHSKSCKERVRPSYRRACGDLTIIFSVMDGSATPEQSSKYMEEYGYQDPTEVICNYGLSIDYILPDKESGVHKGYLQWLVTWGDPGIEWKFYFVPGEDEPYRIEYWFLDWYDSAKVTCTKGRVANLLWQFLQECDTPMSKYREAKKEEQEYEFNESLKRSLDALRIK